MNDNPQLSVHWKVGYPPVQPTNHRELKASTSAESEEYDLEIKLGWPRGTVGMISSAFQQGFSRFTGWKSDKTPVSMKKAARVFRRGVALQGEEEAALRQGSYQIKILEEMPEFKRKAREWFIIDSKVLYHWPALQELDPLVIEATEQTKTLATVAKILEGWRGRLRPPKWTIIGGGVLADAAAFAASEAEVKFAFVPTTLVAMVDACIGGKTGVNFPPFGKNQVGSFYFPDEVLVWPGWLRTLSKRHFYAGGAECLKHVFLMGDSDLAKSVAEALRHHQADSLTPHLTKLISFKAEVIAEDPTEQGRRAILNLGHTIAHALEAISHEDTTGESTLLHGEAVAIGLAFCLLASVVLAELPDEEMAQMWHFLERAKLLLTERELRERTGVDDLRDPNFLMRLLLLLGADKKQEGDRVDSSRFILLRRFGKISSSSPGQFTTEVPHEVLKKLWIELLDRLPA